MVAVYEPAYFTHTWSRDTLLNNYIYIFFREQTWQWLLSPSPTCGKRPSTSPNPSWTPASASCTANPTPPKMASSPSWTPWLLTSGCTSSWPTWEWAVSSLSLPGKLFIFPPHRDTSTLWLDSHLLHCHWRITATFSPCGLLLGSDQGSYVCMASLQNSSRGRKEKKINLKLGWCQSLFWCAISCFLCHF